ncbi:MAG: hypothetical protein J0L92_09150 [Deltaproteobacteria bacterium]|nr:hypothetical protein [Deltaproteobacteria bacterium]
MTVRITDAMRDYLVALARGDRTITTWRAWCDAHRDALEVIHGRAGFLKLKFEPEGGVPAWLASLDVQLSDAGRAMLRKAERGWATTEDVFGVRAFYAEGRREKADARLREAVDEALREGPWVDGVYLGSDLQDLAVDLAALLEDGFVDEARGLAMALAALDANDDRLRPIVDHAREVLDAIERRGR